MSIFSHFQERFEATRQEEYSLQEYLDLCKQDKTAYASAAERLLMAIESRSCWTPRWTPGCRGSSPTR